MKISCTFKFTAFGSFRSNARLKGMGWGGPPIKRPKRKATGLVKWGGFRIYTFIIYKFINACFLFHTLKAMHVPGNSISVNLKFLFIRGAWGNSIKASCKLNRSFVWQDNNDVTPAQQMCLGWFNVKADKASELDCVRLKAFDFEFKTVPWVVVKRLWVCAFFLTALRGNSTCMAGLYPGSMQCYGCSQT